MRLLLVLLPTAAAGRPATDAAARRLLFLLERGKSLGEVCFALASLDLIQDLCDRGGKYGGIERLRQVRMRSQFECTDPVGETTPRRDEDDRDLFRRRCPACLRVTTSLYVSRG